MLMTRSERRSRRTQAGERETAATDACTHTPWLQGMLHSRNTCLRLPSLPLSLFSHNRLPNCNSSHHSSRQQVIAAAFEMLCSACVSLAGEARRLQSKVTRRRRKRRTGKPRCSISDTSADRSPVIEKDRESSGRETAACEREIMLQQQRREGHATLVASSVLPPLFPRLSSLAVAGPPWMQFFFPYSPRLPSLITGSIRIHPLLASETNVRHLECSFS